MPTDATSEVPIGPIPDPAAAVHTAERPEPQEATAHRTDQELACELFELEKQFVMPDDHAIRADAQWFDDHLGKPEFEPYRGTHIAVLNGAIVGHGWNALQLQLDVARKYNVHPQRFILEYVPRCEF